MSYSKTDIDGVYLFQPLVFEDSRGEFYEAFRPDKCFAETGFEFNVAQINTSVSKKGVIRGIHFKKFPPGQAKFVSVAHGNILDVVIDLRMSSETFLQWRAFELSEENRNALLIGYGIGHGFLSLEDNTKISYLCDSIFEPELEFGIDPLDAAINWQALGKPFGIADFVVNGKDLTAPGVENADRLFFD